MRGTIPLLTPYAFIACTGTAVSLSTTLLPSNKTQFYSKLICAFTCRLHVVFDGISVVYPVINTTDGFHKASFPFSIFLRVELLRGHSWTFDSNI